MRVETQRRSPIAGKVTGHMYLHGTSTGTMAFAEWGKSRNSPGKWFYRGGEITREANVYVDSEEAAIAAVREAAAVLVLES